MDKSNTNKSSSGSSTPKERCSASPASSISASTVSSGRSSASVPKFKRRIKPTNFSNNTGPQYSTGLEESEDLGNTSNVVTLNVSTIMGRTFQVRIGPEDTVRQVKQAIQREVGINSEAQVLVYREKALVNECAKIMECDIRDGATLQLVVQMVGGTGVPGGGGCVGRGRALNMKKGEDPTKFAGSEDEVVLLLCKQDEEVYVLEVHLKDGKKVTTGEKRCIGGAGVKGGGSGSSIELAVAGSKGVDLNMEFLCEEEAVKLFQEANLHLKFGLLDDKTKKNGIFAGRLGGLEDINGTGGERRNDEKGDADVENDDFFRPISASSTISSTSLSTFLSLATTMTTTSSSISSPSIGSAFSSRPLSTSSIRTSSRPGSGQNSQFSHSTSTYPPSSACIFSSSSTSAKSSLTETEPNRDLHEGDLRWNQALGRFLPSLSAPSSPSLPSRVQRPATAICVTRIQSRLGLEWDWECLTKIRPKSAGILLGSLRRTFPEPNADSEDEDVISTQMKSKVKIPDKMTNEYLKFPTPPATPPCMTRRHTNRSPRTSMVCKLPLSQYVDVNNEHYVKRKSGPDENSSCHSSDTMSYLSPSSAGTSGISFSESNEDIMNANSMMNFATREEAPIKACVSFSENDLAERKSTHYGSGKVTTTPGRKSATRSHPSETKPRPDRKKSSTAGTQPRSAKSRSKLVSSLPSRSPGGANQHALPHTPRAKCAVCLKRLPLSVSSTFRCRCGKPFCSSHRYTDRHVCSFDYKAEGKIAIAKENPWVGKRRIEKC